MAFGCVSFALSSEWLRYTFGVHKYYSMNADNGRQNLMQYVHMEYVENGVQQQLQRLSVYL